MRRPPELAVGLDDDLVSSAEIVEVVDVLRTKIDLQGAEYISRREADFFGFQTIDIGVDRRRPGVEQREDSSEVGVFVRRVNQGICGAHERLRAEPASVLQHQLEPAGAPETLHQFCKNTNTTPTTKRMATKIVTTTSLIDLEMKIFGS